MKGKLFKTEQGWIVIYDQILGDGIVKRNQNALPLHPDFIEMMDTCFTSKFSHEIEFEIAHFWENGEVGVNGLTYAKLIKEEKPLINNRKDKLETLAKLLAKTWFYCDWKWESPNERVMQMLMQDLGLYPFKDEDEMIQQTKIDDGLDKELYKEASRRIPTYGKLSKDLVENKLDLSKMESKLDESLANETPESLTEWMDSKREDDVEKLAEKYYGPGDYGLESKQGFIKGYNKAKETLYTKQDVIDAVVRMYDIFMDNTLEAKMLRLKGISWHIQNTLESLKQPKQ